MGNFVHYRMLVTKFICEICKSNSYIDYCFLHLPSIKFFDLTQPLTPGGLDLRSLREGASSDLILQLAIRSGASTEQILNRPLGQLACEVFTK